MVINQNIQTDHWSSPMRGQHLQKLNYMLYLLNDIKEWELTKSLQWINSCYRCSYTSWQDGIALSYHDLTVVGITDRPSISWINSNYSIAAECGSPPPNDPVHKENVDPQMFHLTYTSDTTKSQVHINVDTVETAVKMIYRWATGLYNKNWKHSEQCNP